MDFGGNGGRNEDYDRKGRHGGGDADNTGTSFDNQRDDSGGDDRFGRDTNE